MIELTPWDELFWQKLDGLFGEPIRTAYNLEKLNQALVRAIEITTKKDWDDDFNRNRLTMVTGLGQELISWIDPKSDYSESNPLLGLRREKTKWYREYKEQLGKLLAEKYIIENPLVSYDSCLGTVVLNNDL